MGKIQIFAGKGRGKSPAALGEAVLAASAGKHVVIIQFMKGLEESEFQKRLEPEIKLFRFEKSDVDFMELPKERQEEEKRNIRNGLNYAKKVLTTGECDLLILDEVLGLVANDIIAEDELLNVLEARGEYTDIIMTGFAVSSGLCALADAVSFISASNVSDI